ncbi:signal recognition particle subunit SRP72 isoform X1 [Nilaparvata lugens]|uniref:signal recognition particle subunit SRP72 isoform X1 n=2 Tax=Nilaparvata lugens TaxID=108931 RepID=UPI00193E7A56|nr:signal recognition particle subunit SRP72 isoform X1 [Nilaparvata lugens]
MASTNVTSVSVLYAELNKFCQNGDYERALKSAHKVLHHYQDEEKAFHCKIVCLIQLSRFQDALQAFSKQPKFAESMIFEKAYCQYRLNNTLDALKTVESCNEVTLKIKELKAQILYRLERYEECFDVYRDVVKNSNDEYEDERETNLSAVIANLSIEGSTKEVPELREQTYELAYNAACSLIGKKQFLEAERKLKVAEKLCRESLEQEDATEEEIDEELGIIRVQQAYCIQMQGREKEAQAIYNATLKRKPDDIGLTAICSANSVAINRDQNIFDSKKKMKNATSDGLQHKLTSRQRRDIAFNQCLFAMYNNQNDHCVQLCDKLVKQHPEMAAKITLVKAMSLARDSKLADATKLLTSFADSHKHALLEMKLAAVHLLLTEGKISEATQLLNTLGDLLYKPGIVSALVTLYMAQGNRDAASQLLQKAVDWYRKNKVSSGRLSALWRQAADFHLRGGEPAVAAQSLEQLLQLNPDDKKTLAQLVIAYAQFDPEKAKSVSKRLVSSADMTGDADVDTLEAANWMMGTKVIKKTATKVEASPGTPGNELLQTNKKKRKRPGKLPKNCDPNCDPDPERWLPRHERSTFRKKKDRRNKDIGKGTQGAATGAADQFDITKMASTQKTSPNPQMSPAPEGPRQQQRKVQQKKKKKGGKW